MSDYSGEFWIINSTQTLGGFMRELKEAFEEHHFVKVKYTVGKKDITDKQIHAIYPYLRDVARSLNEHGIDYQHFFKRFDFRFSEHSVKEHIWIPVQKALYNTEHIRDLERQQVSEIAEILNKKLAELGIFVPFGEEFNEV